MDYEHVYVLVPKAVVFDIPNEDAEKVDIIKKHPPKRLQVLYTFLYDCCYKKLQGYGQRSFIAPEDQPSDI